MSMTQEQWGRMTIPEIAGYLSQYEIKLKTQIFIDGNAKVGGTKVTVGRMAVCGGIALTGWMKDEPETVIAAAREQLYNITAESPDNSQPAQNRRNKMTSKPTCDDCGCRIGQENGLPYDCEIDNGHTLCHACCAAHILLEDLKKSWTRR